jgi:hypothetical protein
MLAIVALILGVILIVSGVIATQVTVYWFDSRTGSFQPGTFHAGELELIYTFSKG